MAERDGALPVASLLADLRSEVLHGWQPPGGGTEGAFLHCVIHGLDITEAVPLERRVPDDRIARLLGIIDGPGTPNLFGVDLEGVELRANDLEWSYGSGAPVWGTAQALALVVCGRLLPQGRLDGEGPLASPGAERLRQQAHRPGPPQWASQLHRSMATRTAQRASPPSTGPPTTDHGRPRTTALPTLSRS